MRKILAVLLLTVMMMPAVPAAAAEQEEQAPITVTFFRGEPGEQPAENNRSYQKIEKELGPDTMIGAMANYISDVNIKKLEPMNAIQ